MIIINKLKQNYKQFLLSFDNYWNQVQEKIGFWEDWEASI
jgi:hypothetical protein